MGWLVMLRELEMGVGGCWDVEVGEVWCWPVVINHRYI
jgi:hypothetical protein